MQEVLSEALACAVLRARHAVAGATQRAASTDAKLKRGAHAARVCTTGARPVERRAVIDRRADERQAERHVHAVTEGRVFQHRQALIVEHRQHRVVLRHDLGNEQRVGGHRTVHVDALGTRTLDRGGDQFDLLAPEVSALAGMGIEPRRDDARPRQAEAATQVRIEDAQRLLQPVARQCRTHVCERQMSGGECNPKRSVRRVARQHHHDAGGVGVLGQVLGMTAERHPGVIDHALLHRGGDDGVVATVLAPGNCSVKRREHVARVRHVESTRNRRCGQGDMLDPDVGGKSVSGLASSFLDQTGIADQCHIGGQRPASAATAISVRCRRVHPW